VDRRGAIIARLEVRPTSRYLFRMTQLTISVPPALQRWIEARVAEGGYADAQDYLRDLVRRDHERASEDVAWLRAMIGEGLASGVIDREPEEVLDEIIAEDPDLRG
jgi:antitoxin ParD1/3/4